MSAGLAALRTNWQSCSDRRERPWDWGAKHQDEQNQANNKIGFKWSQIKTAGVKKNKYIKKKSCLPKGVSLSLP